VLLFFGYKSFSKLLVGGVFNIKVMFSNLWTLLVLVFYKKNHLKNHWVWLLYPLFTINEFFG